MTQFVNIISEGIRPPDEKRVVALLHDDTIPETRQIVVVIQRGFDAHDHILADFETYWVDGLVSDQWEAETDKEDVRERAATALSQIGDAIATLDDSPSNAEVIAIVRYAMALHRKEIRVLASLLTK